MNATEEPTGLATLVAMARECVGSGMLGDLGTRRTRFVSQVAALNEGIGLRVVVTPEGNRRSRVSVVPRRE